MDGTHHHHHHHQEQQQSVEMVLAEVEAALRTLLLGPALVTMETDHRGGGGKGRHKEEGDGAAAAHRFLQVRIGMGGFETRWVDRS